MQQAPGALAQPGFGGGLLPNRRKSEMAPAAYRSGGHPALVIKFARIARRRHSLFFPLSDIIKVRKKFDFLILIAIIYYLRGEKYYV